MLSNLRKSLALCIATLSLALLPVLVPVGAYALTTVNGNCLAGGSNLQTDCNSNTNTSSGASNLTNIITNIVDVASVIVGVVSVIMIIYGGFRYITSGGDSGNVGSAKNTIIYAVVGLIVVALAQIIVQFVLNRVTNSGS